MHKQIEGGKKEDHHTLNKGGRVDNYRSKQAPATYTNGIDE